MTMRTVLEDVAKERLRQNKKFGEQNHPDGTSRLIFTGLADAAKYDNHRAEKAGTTSWSGILEEEFWEALVETDPERLRAELLQVAAVAIAWIEDIDRR